MTALRRLWVWIYAFCLIVIYCMVRFKYIVLRVQPFGTASLSHLQRSINQWNVNHLQTPAFRAVCLFISEVHFPIIFATTIHSKFDSEMLWFLALCSPYTTSSSHFLVSRILLFVSWKYMKVPFPSFYPESSHTWKLCTGINRQSHTQFLLTSFHWKSQSF